jgi:hypothetical protein
MPRSTLRDLTGILAETENDLALERDAASAWRPDVAPSQRVPAREDYPLPVKRIEPV